MEKTKMLMLGRGEVMTFDEILQDKYYQSEFDKKVAALETQSKNKVGKE